MNFDDLQSAWKNDSGKGGPIPDSIAKIKSANLPLDKVRKNLRNEFFYQIIAIVWIGFLPMYPKFIAALDFWFYIFYTMFVSISGYFLVKLYLFYKRINNQDLSTKDALYETYYDIRLSIELYKTFTYSLMPFVLIFFGMFVLSLNQGAFEQMIETGDFPKSVGYQFAFGFIVAMLTIGFVTELWTHSFYGKYAKEIRKVIDQLKEE
ncbi:hypothetical protein [Flavobacterium sp.]|uniref:hypothetical protein n=1 Tax=Flavobacterium sp. TaxID=239 RepID=UPI0039E5705A